MLHGTGQTTPPLSPRKAANQASDETSMLQEIKERNAHDQCQQAQTRCDLEWSVELGVDDHHREADGKKRHQREQQCRLGNNQRGGALPVAHAIQLVQEIGFYGLSAEGRQWRHAVDGGTHHMELPKPVQPSGIDGRSYQGGLPGSDIEEKGGQVDSQDQDES
jgi:hypothetical protein